VNVLAKAIAADDAACGVKGDGVTNAASFGIEGSLDFEGGG
jgi:hypothetical protein